MGRLELYSLYTQSALLLFWQQQIKNVIFNGTFY